MKLNESLTTYRELSGKASDVARHLAFAGIAVVWIFKTGNATSPKIPSELIPPVTLCVGALACDLLQYVTGALIWGAFHRINEKRNHREDDDVPASPKLNWPALTFYWVKLAMVIIGYVYLIFYLKKQWL